MRALVLALAVLAFGCRKDSPPAPEQAKNGEASHKLPTLTPDEVEQRLGTNDGKFFVYDDNQKKMYDDGHVPGAIWLRAEAVTADALPKDKDATLVFYCANQH